MQTTFLAACELKRKVATALFAAALLSSPCRCVCHRPAQEHAPAATRRRACAARRRARRRRSRSKHRRHDPRHGVAGRQLHHLPRRPLLLPQQAAQGLPRRPQLDDPQGSGRSRGAARPTPTRSSPPSNRSCRRCPASSTRCARAAPKKSRPKSSASPPPPPPIASACSSRRAARSSCRCASPRRRSSSTPPTSRCSSRPNASRRKSRPTDQDRASSIAICRSSEEELTVNVAYEPRRIATRRRCSTWRSRRRPTSRRSIRISRRSSR